MLKDESPRNKMHLLWLQRLITFPVCMVMMEPVKHQRTYEAVKQLAAIKLLSVKIILPGAEKRLKILNRKSKEKLNVFGEKSCEIMHAFVISWLS